MENHSYPIITYSVIVALFIAGAECCFREQWVNPLHALGLCVGSIGVLMFTKILRYVWRS